MHAHEAADTITESAEEKRHEATDRFRSRSAVLIAALAAILAFCELGADNAKDAMIDYNIKASDSWAFYQAKNVRQTAIKLAEDQLKRELASPTLSPASRAAIQADLERYQKTDARYENEPDPKAPGDATKGEGKKQLSARAKSFEHAREAAFQRNDNFDYAQMLLQLAIVLGSVAILTTSKMLRTVCMAIGALGAAFVSNGFWLGISLPF